MRVSGRGLMSVGLLLLAVAAGASPAQAATRTWNGPVDGPWSTPANWSPVGAPANGDDLIFPSAGSASSWNDLAGLELGLLTFEGDHAIIVGFGVTVDNGIAVDALLTVTIDLTVTLGADQSWTPLGQANVTVQEVILNTHEWMLVTEVGSTLIASDVGGGGTIVKTGSGILRLTGANSFTGLLTIEQGFVQVEHHAGLGFADGNLGNGTIVKDGAALLLAGVTATPIEALKLSGVGPTGYGALLINSASPVTIAGPITLSADTRIWSGGTSKEVAFAYHVIGPGALDINGDTLVALTAPGTIFSGTINGAGNLTKMGTGELTLSGANTHEGETAVKGGTLRVTNNAALGLGTATNGTSTHVEEDASLVLDGVTIANELIYLNSGVVPGHVATLRVVGVTPSSLGAPLELAAGSVVTGAAGALLVANWRRTR